MNQLTLPFTIAPLYTFDNLVIHTGNRSAVSAILKFYCEGTRPFPHLFLHGPHGTGKTHILRALTEFLEKSIRSERDATNYIVIDSSQPGPLESQDLSTQLSDDFGALAAVIIDDVHIMAANYGAGLLTLSNKLTTRGIPLILSSLLPPNELFAEDLHLRSRVCSGLLFGLEPPEDPVRILILGKMARDRNVRLPREVSLYLVNHKSRSLPDLSKILDRLDAHSLDTGKRITLSLVKSLEREGLV
jgi:chromosomal replication initiation ATPase DnaA